jgi:pimeloyl-ACP methyl ester carboxylesterase
MKSTIYAVCVLLIFSACNIRNQSRSTMEQTKDINPIEKGHSDVNGLKMYYEIYGSGKPLILIHGGGSTIESNFGKAIPLFAAHTKVIALELQAHGRTSDRGKESSFEQDADDVATLLKNLGITRADFFGFSNGGTSAIQIALRHPQIVDKLVLGSALTKHSGVPQQFWDFMKQAHLDNMPPELKDAYLAVTPDPEGLKIMHDRDAKRMVVFQDIPDELLRSIKAPTLIINGDKDVITAEHAIELHRLIANSELAIIPGLHGEYIGEVTTLKSNSGSEQFVVPMILGFLDKPSVKN